MLLSVESDAQPSLTHGAGDPGTWSTEQGPLLIHCLIGVLFWFCFFPFLVFLDASLLFCRRLVLSDLAIWFSGRWLGWAGLVPLLGLKDSSWGPVVLMPWTEAGCCSPNSQFDLGIVRLGQKERLMEEGLRSREREGSKLQVRSSGPGRKGKRGRRGGGLWMLLDIAGDWARQVQSSSYIQSIQLPKQVPGACFCSKYHCSAPNCTHSTATPSHRPPKPTIVLVVECTRSH